MEQIILHDQDDLVVLYAQVEMKDAKCSLHKLEISSTNLPQMVGKDKLRALQTTTAPLL